MTLKIHEKRDILYEVFELHSQTQSTICFEFCTRAVTYQNLSNYPHSYLKSWVCQFVSRNCIQEWKTMDYSGDLIVAIASYFFFELCCTQFYHRLFSILIQRFCPTLLQWKQRSVSNFKFQPSTNNSLSLKGSWFTTS